MTTTMLPLMTDAPARDLPRPGASLTEPFVVQLTAEDGSTYILPLTLAAAQALVNILGGSEEPTQASSSSSSLRMRMSSSAV
jgi:hypothetical protein